MFFSSARKHWATKAPGRRTIEAPGESLFAAAESLATAQSAMLGLPEVERVFVPHPIQDATDEEMREKARAALGAIVNAITA